MNFKVCCPHRPEDEEPAHEVWCSGGVWVDTGNTLNCAGDWGPEWGWEAPSEEGIYYLLVTFTFPDESQCEVEIVVTIEEEEENGPE